VEFKIQVIVTSFEIVVKDCKILSKLDWQALIVDEAHRLKNQNSTLAIKLHLLNRLHCVLLTGTPLYVPSFLLRFLPSSLP
jgi:SNF2 family DNA or RNA helicase